MVCGLDTSQCVSLYLVRESGVVGDGWGEFERRTAWKQGYVVVVSMQELSTGRIPSAVFGELKKESLYSVFWRVAPVLRKANCQTERWNFVEDQLFTLEAGMYSGSAKCQCGVDIGICQECLPTRENRMFVRESWYKKIRPYADAGWYLGVSDVVNAFAAGGRGLFTR